jgi:hypothetical protein
MCVGCMVCVCFCPWFAWCVLESAGLCAEVVSENSASLSRVDMSTRSGSPRPLRCMVVTVVVAWGSAGCGDPCGATSYGPPIITSFEGLGAAAGATSGGQVVSIQGSNFGALGTEVTARCVVALLRLPTSSRPVLLVHAVPTWLFDRVPAPMPLRRLLSLPSVRLHRCTLLVVSC